MPITHKKTSPIPSLTQPQLDAAIAAGQYPSGTTLDDVILAEDWNDTHDYTGLAELETPQTFTETQTFSKAAQGAWGTSTYAATFTLDMSRLGETITLTGNITFNAVSNLTAGQYKKVEVRLVQSGANRIASFNTAVFKKAGASYPTLSTADGSVDYLLFESQPDGTVIVSMKQRGVA